MTKYMRLVALFFLWFHPAVTLFAVCEKESFFSLSNQCPPGFEKKPDGQCYFDQTSYPIGGTGIAWKKLPVVEEFKQGLNPKVVDLGRFLFFDPVLSGEKKQSCAHCHQPQLGFSDGKKVSVGAHGAELRRGAPSLWNVAFLKHLFWDGRALTLEEQAEGPLFSPEEMANHPSKLLHDLNHTRTYRKLFAEAFGPQFKVIELQHVTKALAEFERTLISLKSPYDAYVHGVEDALSPEQVEGFNVFRSFVSRCSECHTPPLFTNGQFAVLGVPDSHDIGRDHGRGEILKESSLKGAFKVPSLRNIIKTAPYMHQGQFQTLDEVVAFYNRGGGREAIRDSLKIHWHIRPMDLNSSELKSLTLFLESLTDESHIPETPECVPSGLHVLDF